MLKELKEENQKDENKNILQENKQNKLKNSPSKSPIKKSNSKSPYKKGTKSENTNCEICNLEEEFYPVENLCSTFSKFSYYANSYIILKRRE